MYWYFIFRKPYGADFNTPAAAERRCVICCSAQVMQSLIFIIASQLFLGLLRGGKPDYAVDANSLVNMYAQVSPEKLPPLPVCENFTNAAIFVAGSLLGIDPEAVTKPLIKVTQPAVEAFVKTGLAPSVLLGQPLLAEYRDVALSTNPSALTAYTKSLPGYEDTPKPTPKPAAPLRIPAVINSTAQEELRGMFPGVEIPDSDGDDFAGLCCINTLAKLFAQYLRGKRTVTPDDVHECRTALVLWVTHGRCPATVAGVHALSQAEGKIITPSHEAAWRDYCQLAVVTAEKSDDNNVEDDDDEDDDDEDDEKDPIGLSSQKKGHKRRIRVVSSSESGSDSEGIVTTASQKKRCKQHQTAPSNPIYASQTVSSEDVRKYLRLFGMTNVRIPLDTMTPTEAAKVLMEILSPNTEKSHIPALWALDLYQAYGVVFDTLYGVPVTCDSAVPISTNGAALREFKQLVYAELQDYKLIHKKWGATTAKPATGFVNDENVDETNPEMTFTHKDGQVTVENAGAIHGVNTIDPDANMHVGPVTLCATVHAMGYRTSAGKEPQTFYVDVFSHIEDTPQPKIPDTPNYTASEAESEASDSDQASDSDDESDPPEGDKTPTLVLTPPPATTLKHATLQGIQKGFITTAHQIPKAGHTTKLPVAFPEALHLPPENLYPTGPCVTTGQWAVFSSMPKQHANSTLPGSGNPTKRCFKRYIKMPSACLYYCIRVGNITIWGTVALHKPPSGKTLIDAVARIAHATMRIPREDRLYLQVLSARAPHGSLSRGHRFGNSIRTQDVFLATQRETEKLTNFEHILRNALTLTMGNCCSILDILFRGDLSNYVLTLLEEQAVTVVAQYTGQKAVDVLKQHPLWETPIATIWRAAIEGGIPSDDIAVLLIAHQARGLLNPAITALIRSTDELQEDISEQYSTILGRYQAMFSTIQNTLTAVTGAIGVKATASLIALTPGEAVPPLVTSNGEPIPREFAEKANATVRSANAATTQLTKQFTDTITTEVVGTLTDRVTANPPPDKPRRSGRHTDALERMSEALGKLPTEAEMWARIEDAAKDAATEDRLS